MQAGMLPTKYTKDDRKSVPKPDLIHKYLPPTVGQSRGFFPGSLAGFTRYSSKAITILAKPQMRLAAFPKETCAQQSRGLKTSNEVSGFS